MEQKDIMEEIKESNAQQAKYARMQFRMSVITAVASVLALAVICYACAVILPKVNVTYQNMELILQDIKGITSELSEVDMSQMVGDVNHLVSSSEQNLQAAMDKINAIDIDGLNRAINNLSDAVEPFAKFFNSFR